MKRRTAVRLSLLSTSDTISNYTGNRDVSPLTSGRSSNISQSDREWMRIQGEIEENKQLAESAEQSVRAFANENDETFMNATQLREVIQRKGEAIDRARTDALALQEKFLWDLTFAVKRCLVEEKGQTTLEGVALSQVSVQSVVDCAESEDPTPETWSDWIDNKFRGQFG
jgi:hypothetical protein